MAKHTRETVEQLRSDIDSGRTGDKVPADDPAAAPLGTDEEAAGTPVGGDAVALARGREKSGPATAPHRHGPGSAWIVVLAIVVFGLIFLAAGLVLR
jgi:hypothetical protein